jgi:hypothetical protein
MKRATLGLVALLALAGCGDGGGGGEFLAPNEGGALIIVEMPQGGTALVINRLTVDVVDFETNQNLQSFEFGADKLELAIGTWPGATGSCAPLKAAFADDPNTPDTFLAGSSSCITFSLVHAFPVNDQTEQEKLVSLVIRAVKQDGTVGGQRIQTVRMLRQVFQGDPAEASDFNDLAPFVATLQIL